MMIEVLWIAFPQFETREMYKISKILGYRPYSNTSTYTNKGHAKAWKRHLLNAEPMDWDRLFQGYNVALELPSTLFYRDLFKQNPQLKVIIYDIDYQLAYKQYKRLRWFMYILKWIKIFKHPREYLSLGEKSLHFLFKGDDSQYNAIKEYKLLIEDLKRTIPPHQILTFKPSEGWKPICYFLEKEVPAQEFPIQYSKKKDKTIVKGIILSSLLKRDAILIILYFGVLASLLVYLLFFY